MDFSKGKGKFRCLIFSHLKQNPLVSRHFEAIFKHCDEKTELHNQLFSNQSETAAGRWIDAASLKDDYRAGGSFGIPENPQKQWCCF